ncbi:hypothetical protein HYS84_02550 [Candidatus Saccharibacteria bacterium]|nr:hypothetical protein [Candidatus Saccharibacteria bacterium]
MKTVFLSGPIKGISRDESLAWRDEARKLLKEKFNVVHALRGREVKETLPDSRIAIQRDKADILRSDVILINDTSPSTSMIGTSMEVLFAFENNKLVVVFGSAHAQDYWLLYHSHVRFNNLKEACKFLNKSYHD